MKRAVVIILRRDTRVLIIRRGAGIARAGHWSPPTGRVEDGEPPADAVAREALEEIGVVVEPVAEVWRSETDDARYALHWWTARLVSGVPTPDGIEVDDLRWCTAAEFLTLTPIFDSHRAFFTDVLPTLARD